MAMTFSQMMHSIIRCFHFSGVCAGFVILFCSSHIYAESLDKVSLVSLQKDEIQIKMQFSSMPKYHQFLLRDPARIVFDFANLNLKTEFKQLSEKTEFIKSVRFSKRGDQGLRLVLDVKNELQISINNKQENHRAELVLNLSSVKKKGAVIAEEAPIPDVLLPFLKEHEAKAKLKMRPNYRDVIVMIDPGHGGKDPGASGARNTLEKEVVLQIAMKLKKMVDQTRGMKAYLTRKGDYYVGLRERLDIARKHKADIFVSIHADAFLNRQSRGASVYSLSQRGATSEAARWLAASENYSELGGVDLSDLDDDNGMVRSVLLDLSQTATISASLTLGKAVLSGIDNIATLHHDDVEQARFVVLKSPDIPSILVETGFISNSQEERLLASPHYQTKLATSILEGITQYFKAYPPVDSAMAHRKQTYQVARGDTLSDIAKKFNVPASLIKKTNNLSSDHLKMGQKLEVYFDS